MPCNKLYDNIPIPCNFIIIIIYIFTIYVYSLKSIWRKFR